MPEATVLMPTHSHGPTVLRAARSALLQTVEDLELFIVGDGVPDVTRQIAAELGKMDPRVRFFDNPKGPRHGEIHRNAALAHARGEIVCYLSDDDLWLPDHVERMRCLLEEADFTHALPLSIGPDGALGHVWTVDLSLPECRAQIQAGHNTVPLSCAAHTLAFYRQLPAGWRTSPPGVPTDLFLWQKFLAEPHCRAVSGTWPSVLHFPSPERPDATLDERVAELDLWSVRLEDPEWHARFVAEALDLIARDRARQTMALAGCSQQMTRLDAAVRDRDAQLAALDRVVRDRDDQLALLDRALRDRDEQVASLDRAFQNRSEELASARRALQSVSSSRAWRLYRGLARLRKAGSSVTAVARAGSRRSDPGGAAAPHRARRG